MNKKSIFNQIIAQLQDAQKKAKEARDAAQEEANRHVGRMESRYDTFKEEAQYDVAAQELRISKYQVGIDQVTALLTGASIMNPSSVILVGSIVKLKSETEGKFYVLSPAGGGIVTRGGDTPVFVLTPDSPLGKKLIGLKVGDVCVLNIGGSEHRLVVQTVE